MKLEYNTDGDQWTRDGDCSKCRRQKYCGNPCKASKMRRDRIFRETLAEVVARMFGKKGAEDEG